MGKEEDKTDPSDEETNSTELTKSAEETTEEEVESEQEETKTDTEELRKIIKVNNDEENEEEKTPEKIEEPQVEETITDSRETLEQKRAILQSIKDFDFQIKKNQEEINRLNIKLDSVTKDLDDLVSLYEIVSEQMNPFVGLSKVTKKRIDALENFTKEIEDLKDRTGELESFAVRSGARLKKMKDDQEHKVKTIDTDALLNDEEQLLDGKSSEIEGYCEPSGDFEKQEETETDATDSDLDTLNQYPEAQGEPQQFIEDNYEEFVQPIFESKVENNLWENLSDYDLDIIIERTLGGPSPDSKIDVIIDEFIESLKG